MKMFTLRIIAGANVATIAAMLAVGYADRLDPTAHPLLANVGLLFPVFLAANAGFLLFWLTVKKLWALIPFAGLVIGYGPIRVYSPLNMKQDVPEGAIKVMSYNVFNFSTWDYTSGPSEILDYIRQQQPDILCMQEAATVGRKYELIDSTLTSMLAYKDTVNSGSIAVYSRFPIVGKERIHYYSKSSNASAAFLLKTGPGDTTAVIVNHFEITGISLEQRAQFKAMLKGKLEKDSATQESRALWRSLAQSAAIRAPQADAVARYISRHPGRSTILTGDFNDSPLSYVRRRLADELTDCYEATANGPGISYHYSGFYVRIDNIMCSADWTPYQCRVDNSIGASDHYPIVCWLKKRK